MSLTGSLPSTSSTNLLTYRRQEVRRCVGGETVTSRGGKLKLNLKETGRRELLTVVPSRLVTRGDERQNGDDDGVRHVRDRSGRQVLRIQWVWTHVGPGEINTVGLSAYRLFQARLLYGVD